MSRHWGDTFVLGTALCVIAFGVGEHIGRTAQPPEPECRPGAFKSVRKPGQLDCYYPAHNLLVEHRRAR